MSTRMSTSARLDRLESMIEALIEAQSPAIPSAPAPATVVSAPATPAKPAKALCRSTRKAFIAAAKREGRDFAKCSTQAIAAMCVEDPSLVPAGFRIGEGYTSKFAA